MSDFLQYSLFMPESKWIPPASFPIELLRSDEPISIDTETKDPLLKKQGPSWRYREGSIAGLCLATKDRQWYFPIAHLGGGNLPCQAVLDFFTDLLKVQRTVFMANAAYDVGWLQYAGVLSDTPHTWPYIEDIILTEALLCEDHPGGYSLDAISQRRLGRHKDEELLKAAAKEFGLNAKADLWKFPAKYVGQYGEIDARNTFDCAMHQRTELEKEGIEDIFNLEQRLIPVFHETTRRGIAIDINKAEKLNREVLIEETKLRDEVRADPWSDDEKTRLREDGWKLPYTDKGQTSCTKAWLASNADWNDREKTLPNNLPAKILKLRELNRLRSVYVEDAIKWAIDGRVHPQFLQLASDEGGARSGRVASKNPNFQQIPSRTSLGKKIRKLYYAFDWGKFDYSSQEPRWQVHYGIHCEYSGARDMCNAFMEGKKLYTFMEENIPGCSYADAKMLVLAKSYGMGLGTLAETLSISRNDAEDLVNKFDTMVPYIGQLAHHATAIAKKRGFIKTILGRKRRFLYWENPDKREAAPVFGYKAARKRWPKGQLRRAHTHKAFNALIQGTSADQTKKAMLDIWDELKIAPLCQVHDELDYEVSSQSQIDRIKWIMENAIPNTNIAFKVDCDIGKTWR